MSQARAKNRVARRDRSPQKANIAMNIQGSAGNTEDLKHKPLVECIFEMKWLSGAAGGGKISIDPYNKLLVGCLYDRLKRTYPEHEQLQTASLPDQVVGQTVQHRFRAGQGKWPLVQIGPGILTVNDTEGYVWRDFRKRAFETVAALYAAHPNRKDVRIQSLVLRYIDAISFDYSKNNLLTFLKGKLHVAISLPDSLFTDTGVNESPRYFDWQAAFDCVIPKGKMMVRLATGLKETDRVLVWETHISSENGDLPPMPSELANWLEAAHGLTHDWFFKLIKGDLLRRFRGD